MGFIYGLLMVVFMGLKASTGVAEPEVTLLPMMAVEASEAQGSNVPANTIDGDLQTHWAAEGQGQWITYDVGRVSTVQEVAIAWVEGDQYMASFSIEVSVDSQNWTEVWFGESSGATRDFEGYTFSSASARYVRIVGYGNSADTWNRIAETEVYGQLDSISLPIAAAQANRARRPHVAANAIDDKMATRWAARGRRRWIRLDIGVAANVDEVAIAWTWGDRRKASFSIAVSDNRKNWTEVFRGQSSGTTTDFESYTFPATSARFVRIMGFGNSANKWNSINEIERVRLF